MSGLHLTAPLAVSFAVYGALHALAFVSAIRGRGAISARALFIVAAAALCLMAFRFASWGLHLIDSRSGELGLYSLVGLSAIIGAVSYGALIRLSGMHAMNVRELAAIAVGCLFAADISLFTGRLFHFPGTWWFATLWWFTFSGGLWYFERRPQ